MLDAADQALPARGELEDESAFGRKGLGGSFGHDAPNLGGLAERLLMPRFNRGSIAVTPSAAPFPPSHVPADPDR